MHGSSQVGGRNSRWRKQYVQRNRSVREHGTRSPKKWSIKKCYWQLLYLGICYIFLNFSTEGTLRTEAELEWMLSIGTVKEIDGGVWEMSLPTLRIFDTFRIVITRILCDVLRPKPSSYCTLLFRHLHCSSNLGFHSTADPRVWGICTHSSLCLKYSFPDSQYSWLLHNLDISLQYHLLKQAFHPI